ncbi:MAG: glycosyltransferase family 2 protein [Desulfobulbaceae bacterium]|nr:glycosyltransferase family 2 protein [Desulfobulbaceae bacterium]
MSEQLRTLQVVSPVYNEENMIGLFYEALKNVLVKLEDRYDWKILFVMDRSTDRSLQVLRDLAEKDDRVQVLGLSNRFGHQMSLVAGIDHTDSDAVIMMDSDLQHPPELIPQMLDAFEQGNDVVFTIRREPKDSSAIKRMGSRAFYRLMNRLSELSLSSGEADFRLISRRVADVFKNDIRERNQFLRGLFRWVGFERVGISYDPADRIEGVSKYNWSRMFSFASSGIVSFSKKPLQYAIFLGIFFSFMGLLSAVYTFISFFISDQVPSGWTTLSILVSVFGGIQLFFLGIIGEYIGAIFDEVKSRPLYLVEEYINID